MIISKDARCFVCQEAITNPICPSCLTKEIKIWLEDINSSLVKEFKKKVKYDTITKTDTKCILCNNYTDTCPYCFTELVYFWLKEKHPEFVESFLTYFNYDFERTGYKKE